MWHLFLTFLKLGTFIFGSGHALASAMQNEIVEKNGWLTTEQFQNGWASGNILPGPIATKVPVFVGYQQAGVWGAVLSTVAYLLPSTAGMALFASLLTNPAIVQSSVVKSILRGIKPAVLALLVEAFLSFTGIAFPKGNALLAQWAPFTVILLGVVVSLAGVRWLSAAGTGGSYLLADWRAMAIFALSIAALYVLRVESAALMLGAAVLGLTYLIF